MRKTYTAKGKIVDNLKLDTRDPAEKLIFSMYDSIKSSQTSVGNIQAITQKVSKARNGLYVGSPSLGTFIPNDPAVFTGFIALQPVSFLGYALQSVLSSTFQINVTVNLFVDQNIVPTFP
jgi:hypothetical protein